MCLFDLHLEANESLGVSLSVSSTFGDLGLLSIPDLTPDVNIRGTRGISSAIRPLSCANVLAPHGMTEYLPPDY